MPTQTFENVEPIYRGYDATITIQYPQSIWDSLTLGTARLRAAFKNKLDDDAAIFTADSDNSDISVNAPERKVTIAIPAASTELFTKSDVHFDIAAINGSNQEIVPGRWAWSVNDPVTDPVTLP